jgi:hypothetical protein
MSLALLIILAPLLQDTQDLRWRLEPGQKYTCSWSMRLIFNDPAKPGDKVDMTQEFTGTVEVTKTDKDKTEFTLLLKRLALKGTFRGSPLDVLYEGGETKKPAAPRESAQNIKRECEKPGTLSLTPTGEYKFSGKHIVASYFQGQSDFFGPQVPGKAVDAAAEWEGTLEGPPTGTAKKAPPVKVKYKLASVENNLARIQMKETKDIESGDCVINANFTSDSHFNVAGGFCAKSTATVKGVIKLKGAPAGSPTADVETTMNFEMTPEKK